ncbi:hypothetical protein QSH18_03295 [Xanthomonas sp. NCPPB 2654]|uniref:hypothetical protein n=1 Tax=unclassified Xanthomonas TaxID=2643310 RepID=UPI0021DFFC45|nr:MULTISPECIES: hypothetical protein [unclassified Xanthomonas]MDL5364624.1 hypothetical protein [Xanthomonas sp. NCPPB 2654]UYC21939.1 hypothetical protein NUG20_06500 [Xanthomonas sp. CFBP 8443]
MSIGKSVTPAALLFCAGSLFVVLGLLANPLYFSAAFACLAASAAMRGDARHRVVYGALAIVFLLVVLGYGIGKDLAQRDNLRDAQAMANADRQ